MKDLYDIKRLVKLNNPRFDTWPWGKVVAVVEMGDYSIVVDHPRVEDGVTLTEDIDTSKLMYHPFVNGKYLNYTFYNLDRALLAAIAYKHGDIAAAQYAAKVLNVPFEA